MINRVLYANMCHFAAVNGQPSPRIKDENDPMYWETYTEITDSGLIKKRRVTDSGEEYIMNCPFCGDRGGRLYVNHRFGVYDEATNSMNLWLANCYNEQCLSNTTNQLSLHYMLFGHQKPLKGLKLPETKKNLNVVKPVPLPGLTTRLDVLNSQDTNHKALTYLRSRGWDPVLLGSQYDFGYCGVSHIYYASDRIIMPVYKDGLMVGWQARFIGDDLKGVPLKKLKIPKYYTSPGFSTGKWSYNFDIAKRFKTIVLTEGIFDAINTGPYAIAVFGKSLSETMRSRIIFELQQCDGTVVVMLDPTQDDAAKKKGELHHIKKVARSFNRSGLKITEVYLPSDPGSTSHNVIVDCMRRQSLEQGVTLDLSLRKL